MSRWKLQRRRGQGHAKLFADGFDTGHATHNVFGRWLVVVIMGPSTAYAGCQNPRVKGTTDNDRYAALRAHGQKGLHGALLQQGVSPSQQKAVEVTVLQSLSTHLPFVGAQAKGGDQSRVAQLDHGLEAAFHKIAPMAWVLIAVGTLSQIMGQQNIHLLTSQAYEAVFKGAHHAVVAIVELGF